MTQYLMISFVYVQRPLYTRCSCAGSRACAGAVQSLVSLPLMNMFIIDTHGFCTYVCIELCNWICIRSFLYSCVTVVKLWLCNQHLLHNLANCTPTAYTLLHEQSCIQPFCMYTIISQYILYRLECHSV